MEKLRDKKGRFIKISDIEINQHRPTKPLPYVEAILFIFSVLGTIVLLNQFGYIKPIRIY